MARGRTTAPRAVPRAARAQPAAEPPCYSARLMLPFLQVLSQTQGFPTDALEKLQALDPDERIPVRQADELLTAAVQWTRDPLLGLKAGSLMSIGDCGAIDYAMRSAATVGDALAVAKRYMRFVNDALDLRVELDGERVVLRLEPRVPMPTPAIDFMMSSFYVTHTRSWLRDLAALECWLPVSAPANRSAYERVFAPARLRFAAPWSAFVFDRSELAQPLADADPKLHAVISKFVAQAVAELPAAHSLADKVRDMVSEELPHGEPTAAHVARRLHMSSRTLGRKLGAEGTTFTALFDDLRKRLALHYVCSDRLELAQVAFLLGFSEPTAFHRAFKRWTGQTPLEYRRAHRT